MKFTSFCVTFLLSLKTNFHVFSVGACSSPELFRASDPIQDQDFGSSVAIQGNRFVVAAPGNGVYLFVNDGGVWSEEQKLVPDDGAGGQFGSDLALDGDYIVVGARRKDSNRGAVYVFSNNGDMWEQDQQLVLADRASGDFFGTSVAIEGDTVVIGATGIDTFTGAAYVYSRQGASWEQVQVLAASSGQQNDNFGGSVAVAGNYLLASAEGANSNRGIVFVYFNDGTTWTNTQELVPSGAGNNNFFGRRQVAIEGDTLIVGAEAFDSAAGAAFVFVLAGNVWVEQQRLTAPVRNSVELFGHSVAIQGDNAVVGAFNTDGAKGTAYIFTRDGSSWADHETLVADDRQNGDTFGLAVALDGDNVLVGEPSDDTSLSNVGAVNLFNDCLPPQPSAMPSDSPSSLPSSQPSDSPSSLPSSQPSGFPSLRPSSQPSASPRCHWR